MDRSTHVRLSLNDSGEVESQELNVIGETASEGPHRLLSIDLGPLVESLDEAAVEAIRANEVVRAKLMEDCRPIDLDPPA